MIILAATPIGNLGDASRRLVEALETVKVIATEDTRTTQRLLAGLGVTNRPRLIALHDHNEKARAGELAELARDEDLLVMSEAGMPTVSDPGYGLVSAAVELGVTVTAIPGPSAVLTALAVSGLPTDRFTFEGFPPRKAGEQRSFFGGLAAERRTMVFFEAPSRLAVTLAAMAQAFGADRPAAVCRELTKMHEEIVRDSLAALAGWASGGVRGEVVVVVAGAAARAVDPEDALAQVLELVADGVRLKDAAGQVAAASGLSSRELYAAALSSREGRVTP
ncbi:MULTISPECIES: 16S rRNA (cytidine(1402)-2'-O)-methyltransferase [unclassified Microbacterium]|uniref:16S rRNA (cytidine(1402)-2'-O)-methyltransferase n=1 Tax=unclassified Microbacterium TaxID=2609290 RepID=UPI00214C30DB|nr:MULTISPECIES: 16S rRNA (cytidine(1402)-2'-O)-methyltransferase [unclassified Microbacterium]MCR2784278.1 16S rRNA (cytidine(1402)-2'-O)-methyltransferase [Microbacterium sp. zg.B96]MDL5350814.1 16S rRNA (cytidine(1402)-2'-O)-methyltransferase [Microbacterium sp. zg-YB36]WIM14894.1 16S rRNA (cytidine(1402)-2'-O)-methyltransferase [Microbacterium sp. zg-B96]